ncbi:hypothetical protein CPB84DRAFT_1794770, partial [Gymnopilus junonius]
YILTVTQGLFFSFLLILVGAHIPFTTAIHLSLLYSDHHLTRLHPPLPLQSKFMFMIITLYASSTLPPAFFTETDLFFILGCFTTYCTHLFIHLFIYYY